MSSKRPFAITITYFKPSGKMYSTEEVTWEIGACEDSGSPTLTPYMQDAVDRIKAARAAKTLPGLAGGWEGPILVDCEEGFPVLIPPEDVEDWQKMRWPWERDYPRAKGEEFVRVFRLLEYVGPRHWVERTLANSIQGDYAPTGADFRIRSVVLGGYPDVFTKGLDSAKEV